MTVKRYYCESGIKLYSEENDLPTILSEMTSIWAAFKHAGRLPYAVKVKNSVIPMYMGV